MHQRGARLLAACIFVTIMLGAGGLSAQQVLLAPQVTLSFDTLQISGQPQAVEVAYGLDQNDWKWAEEMGFDLWLAAYQRSDGQAWQLRHAKAMDKAEGTAKFTEGMSAGARDLGLCLIAATEGGRLAPGMGYICETPVTVSTDGTSYDWKSSDASVTLKYERQVDEQPFYTAARGFVQATQSEAQVDTAGDFIVYRAPTSPIAAERERARQRRAQRGAKSARDRRHRRMVRSPYYSAPYGYNFGQGTISGFSDRFDRFDRFGRFGADIFRQRRFQAGQFFGPFDSFDSRFNEDMFSPHPDDAFYSFPITPGPFGRDAFGHDLPGTFENRIGSDMFRTHPGDVFYQQRVAPGHFGRPGGQPSAPPSGGQAPGGGAGGGSGHFK